MYHNKGLTKKRKGQRDKWITNEYKFQEMIKPPTNNPSLNYLILRKSGYLASYLQYNPEVRHTFDFYRNICIC